MENVSYVSVTQVERVLATGMLLVYSGTKWVNTDALPDNTLFIRDDLDGTKKMQVQLSGLTENSTVTLTSVSTTIAGADVTQTLTSKTTIDDASNVRAESLKSLTPTVDQLGQLGNPK